MVNNINIIRDFITHQIGWNSEEMFMLQIIQRSKDGHSKSSKTLKTYLFDGLEYFDSKMDEIINVCDTMSARAYINLNPKPKKLVALMLLKELASRIASEQYNGIDKLYYSCVGQCTGTAKSWVIDVDTLDDYEIQEIKNNIDFCDPIGERKIRCEIPTKNGIHLITTPFNIAKFGIFSDSKMVHKNNPTLLYAAN